MNTYNVVALTGNIAKFSDPEYFLIDLDNGEPKLTSIADPAQAIMLVFTVTHSNYSIYIQREILKLVRTRGYRWEHQLKRKGKRFIKDKVVAPYGKEILRLLRYISSEEIQAFLSDANKQFFKFRKIH